MRSPLFAGYAVLFSKAVTSGFQRSKDIFRAIFINIENLTVHMLRNIRVTIQVLQQHFIGAGNDALTRDIDNCKERRIRISNSFVEFFAKSAASVNRNAGNPLRLHTCHCTMCVGIRSGINQIVANKTGWSDYTIGTYRLPELEPQSKDELAALCNLLSSFGVNAYAESL